MGMRQGIEAEVMLLNWSESANSGCKLVFEISAEDLEPFKALKTRAGKKVAGQRFAAVLVLIDDDESVVPAEPAKNPDRNSVGVPNPREKSTSTEETEPAKHPAKRGGFSPEVGPRARLAVQWCDDERFQQWINGPFGDVVAYIKDASYEVPQTPSDMAKRVICVECGIKSRKELDTDPSAGAAFDEQFRIPYAEHLKTLGVAA